MMCPRDRGSGLHKLTNRITESVACVIQKKLGVDISCYDNTFFRRTVEKRIFSSSCSTTSGYIDLISGNSSEAEELVRSLNVTYSEFFRNPLSFALLRQVVIPALFEKRYSENRGEIRVWSSGCGTGQEVWSLAILFDEIASLYGKPPAFRIFGTDISERNIEAAREGAYLPESMGNVTYGHLQEYFIRDNGFFRVAPGIRKMVDFSLYDLLDKDTCSPSASIYGHFDLVLCCNVMLYYNAGVKRFILDKLRRSMVNGGYLLIGETEKKCMERTAGFRAISPPSALFQKKRERE